MLNLLYEYWGLVITLIIIGGAYVYAGKKSEVILVHCDKCGGFMREGVYTAQTFTGIGDFHDNDKVVTISPGGPGRLEKCSKKCEVCGRSVT